MKVKDLIEILKQVENTNMEVCFADTNNVIHDIEHVKLAKLSEHIGVGVLLTTHD